MIDFPIIDSHIHLLDRTRFSYSWSSGSPWARGVRKLERDWTANDLDSYAKPYQVEGFVFVEADVDMPQYLAEARWISDSSTIDRRILACVGSLPLEKGLSVEHDMRDLASNPIARGVRRLIQNLPDSSVIAERSFVEALNLLPKYQLSFDICIDHHQFPEAIEMVRQCPEVTFVLDHLGKPPIAEGTDVDWRRHITEIAAFRNVRCKLSGVLTQADHRSWTWDDVRPYIDHVLEVFGADRILFGGDWPVLELAATYRDWVEVVEKATSGMSRDDIAKIFRNNAIEVYRLNNQLAVDSAWHALQDT
jgi:L-fuconolactonase